MGELGGMLGATYPNVSQHVNVMHDAGLVASRREGTTSYYRLAYPQIHRTCDIVSAVLRQQLADVVVLATD